MALKPHHLGLSILVLAVVLAATLALRHHLPGRPGDRAIPDRQVFDRSVLVADLDAAGLHLGDAAHVRIFKREKRLEL